MRKNHVSYWPDYLKRKNIISNHFHFGISAETCCDAFNGKQCIGFCLKESSNKWSSQQVMKFQFNFKNGSLRTLKLYSLIFILPCWATGLHHAFYTLKWNFFVSYLFLYVSCQARQGDCIFTRWISWPVDGNWIDGWWTLHHIYFRCILRSAIFNRQGTLQLYVGIPKPIVKFLHHGLKCKKQDF